MGDIFESISVKAAQLATRDQTITQAAYELGRHYGMAFQLIDDVLDLTAENAQLGSFFIFAIFSLSFSLSSLYIRIPE